MPSAFTTPVQANYVGAATANANSAEIVFLSPVNGTFTGAIIPNANLTGAAGSFRTVRFINRGQAGIGTTVMATLAFDSTGQGTTVPGGDLRAITPVTTGTPPANTVAVGDTIALDTTFASSGQILPPGLAVGYFTGAN